MKSSPDITKYRRIAERAFGRIDLLTLIGCLLLLGATLMPSAVFIRRNMINVQAGLESQRSAAVDLAHVPSEGNPLMLCFSTQDEGFMTKPAKGPMGSEFVPTPAKICQIDNRKAWVSVSGFAHLLLYYRLGLTDLPTFTSGQSMLTALTDEDAAIHAFGKSPFVKTQNGVRYYLFNDPVFHSTVGEMHRDQCLATFADLDLPLNTLVSLKSGRCTLLDFVKESVANFSFDQWEPAWTSMAYARYLPPAMEWTNKFGEVTTFSQLTQHLLQQDYKIQSCGGTHIFESLICIYNADIKRPILDQDTRRELKSYLTNTVAEIAQRQNANGSWPKQWCKHISPDYDIDGMKPHELDMLVTGHVLQTLRELPPALRPEEAVYMRAAEWLREVMTAPDVHCDVTWLCPYTHAALNARAVLKSKSNLSN